MPILTLTSDTGNQDYVSGSVKGILLNATGNSYTLVEITHSLAPFNLSHAAYICRNVQKNFPPGTCHAILVNLFGQKKDYLLAAAANGQTIFCADNGLLSMMLDELPEQVVMLPFDKKYPKNVLGVASLIGQALVQLNNGTPLNGLGTPTSDYVQKHNLKPKSGPDHLEGQIIFTDHFENVIINITRELFEEHRRGRSFKIVFKRDEIIDRISETYGDVPEGEKLALFNAAGYLEIAINQGNAAGLFGLQGMSLASQTEGAYMQNRLFYQTVKIYFS
ncbi:MAG: SAM-dependent chlorinase/fluorinase [Dinghuibacter sp.]|nr:SAM-dependent chlorinase/fluorinase [Dinghuibacter sp.]